MPPFWVTIGKIKHLFVPTSLHLQLRDSLLTAGVEQVLGCQATNSRWRSSQIMNEYLLPQALPQASMVKLSGCVLWVNLGCMPAPSVGGWKDEYLVISVKGELSSTKTLKWRGVPRPECQGL